MIATHKLAFEGSTERDLMGRCRCGEVILQSGHGTARQQIRANHRKHVENMLWAERIKRGEVSL